MDVVAAGRLRGLPRPIAFVLSGGGSLGSAQVGHLLALRAHGVRPDLVVGTSVGAINGAAVADDPDHGAERLRDIWISVRRHDVLPLTPKHLLAGPLLGRSGLWPLSGVSQLVQRNLSTTELGDLTIPMHAIATDAITGELVDVSEGPVLDALVASSAIPGVFPTHQVAGRWLLDGGIRAQVPVNHAMDLGARTAIVLDASGPCEHTRPPRSILESIALAMRYLTRSQAEAQTEAASLRGLVLYLPTPCSHRRSPLDFRGSVRLMTETEHLTDEFLAALSGPFPDTGLIGGFPTALTSPSMSA